MATRVHESAVIVASIADVWAVIRGLNFSFLSTVEKVDVEGHADAVGSLRTITYKDKTQQKVKLVELSDAAHKLSWELIESNPPTLALSAIHTLALRRISHDNTTLLEFTSDYSKDATDEVIQDSKYKKLEFFGDLRTALARGAGVKTASKPEEKKHKAVPAGGIPKTRFERSFIAIKPDGVQRGLIGDIIGRFEKRGFKLVGLKLLTPTAEQAAGHYSDLSSKPFFRGLVEFFSSGPIVAMVWEGANVIALGRAMLGATNPTASAPGTIRGDFAVETGRNVCHGSDGPESAQKEINFWFKPEELNSWENASVSWVYENL